MPWVPEVEVLTIVVAPVETFQRKISLQTFVSPETRVVASDVYVTYAKAHSRNYRQSDSVDFDFPKGIEKARDPQL